VARIEVLPNGHVLVATGLQRYVDARFAGTVYNALLKGTGQQLMLRKGIKFSCPKCGAKFST